MLHVPIRSLHQSPNGVHCMWWDLHGELFSLGPRRQDAFEVGWRTATHLMACGMRTNALAASETHSSVSTPLHDRLAVAVSHGYKKYPAKIHEML